MLEEVGLTCTIAVLMMPGQTTSTEMSVSCSSIASTSDNPTTACFEAASVSANGDDLARATGLAHTRKKRTHAVHDSHDIDVVDAPPFRKRRLFEAAEERHARVVHQHVEWTDGRVHRRGQLEHGIFPGYVAGASEAGDAARDELGADRFERLLIDVRNHEPGAALREGPRALEADARRGARHEHLPAFEVLHAEGPK